MIGLANWRVGELVEVRGKSEILSTLDERGRLESLPLLPQMLELCGKRFKIHRNAYKTCDTVSGRYIGLQINECVHLDVRCNGGAYDGCQAACLLFWKTAWLRPVIASARRKAEADAICRRAQAGAGGGCTEEQILAATRTIGRDGKQLYVCQATALLDYTTPLKWWRPRQYVEAYRTGNHSLAEIAKGLLYLGFAYGLRADSPRYGALGRWLYDRLRWLWGGIAYPRRADLLKPTARAAPRIDLGLKPGDQVRVKSHKEIMATLDKKGSNLGLMFDAEMVPYCGKEFRIKAMVERFVNEADGKLTIMKTPAVILDGAVCMSRFSGQRMFCPREIFSWWREVWLERVEPAASLEADDRKLETSLAV